MSQKEQTVVGVQQEVKEAQKVLGAIAKNKKLLEMMTKPSEAVPLQATKKPAAKKAPAKKK